MAHELTKRADGFIEMAYTGEKPWHGLGQQLDQNASIDDWVTAAGMDWKVQRAKVRYPTSADDAANAVYAVDDSKHVLFRSDSKAALAIVGEGFHIVQPRETLEFFRDLVADAGYKLCTAGVLKGGVKFWAQATMGLKDNIVGNDVVESKLLLATACDGSMRTLVKEVSERVVCANTLAIATKEKGGRLVQVSHRSVFDADAVKSRMGIAITHFQTFITQARSLAKQQVGPSDVDKFLLSLLFSETLETPEQQTAARASTGYAKIAALFNGGGRGSQLPGVAGTAWGLVNSVTEYIDHSRGNAATTRDNRLDHAWFGPGDALKTAAFDSACALAGA